MKIEIPNPIQSKSIWTGLDYESNGSIQSISYSENNHSVFDDNAFAYYVTTIISTIISTQQYQAWSTLSGIFFEFSEYLVFLVCGIPPKNWGKSFAKTEIKTEKY